MIGRLNHVAIAVPDLEQAAETYRNALGAKVGAPQDEPDHGVTVIFIELPNTKIEDIIAARDHLKETGLRVLGDGEPKIGAHGKPVIFLHPKDLNGTLTELEQV